MNVYDTLVERGLLAQVTHPDQVRELLQKERVPFYIGFDPTADSLHIGHFLQMVVMRHMQLFGHRPIALIGGGTAMVGDPSGRTDMRQMMTPETIAHNAERFKSQLACLLEFGPDKAIMVNNADWLMGLCYVDFLRDVGVHFSVNRMLTAECFKSRLEVGLSFIEFNYMLMQSYDFLHLFRQHGCKLQLGGDDQWSNIIQGIDLIRRKEGAAAYGMTFNLLTTSDGKKMGKTAKGALWLDKEKCSPYDFYQYFRNVADEDVIRLLKMVTFLPMEQIKEFETESGAGLNKAKVELAFQVTKLIHGEECANQAMESARKLFVTGGVSENMPTYEIQVGDIDKTLLEILVEAKFIPSKSEGRRLIKQNGLALCDKKVTDENERLTKELFLKPVIVRKGKKSYLRILCST